MDIEKNCILVTEIAVYSSNSYWSIRKKYYRGTKLDG
jgi:hypothetical protein